MSEGVENLKSLIEETREDFKTRPPFRFRLSYQTGCYIQDLLEARTDDKKGVLLIFPLGAESMFINDPRVVPFWKMMLYQEKPIEATLKERVDHLIEDLKAEGYDVMIVGNNLHTAILMEVLFE